MPADVAACTCKTHTCKRHQCTCRQYGTFHVHVTDTGLHYVGHVLHVTLMWTVERSGSSCCHMAASSGGFTN